MLVGLLVLEKFEVVNDELFGDVGFDQAVQVLPGVFGSRVQSLGLAEGGRIVVLFRLVRQRIGDDGGAAFVFGNIRGGRAGGGRGSGPGVQFLEDAVRHGADCGGDFLHAMVGEPVFDEVLLEKRTVHEPLGLVRVVVVLGRHFLEALGHAVVFGQRKQYFRGSRRQRVGDALDFVGVVRGIGVEEGVQGQIGLIVPRSARAGSLLLPVSLVDEGDGQHDVVRVRRRAAVEARRSEPERGGAPSEENEENEEEEGRRQRGGERSHRGSHSDNFRSSPRSPFSSPLNLLVRLIIAVYITLLYTRPAFKSINP